MHRDAARHSFLRTYRRAADAIVPLVLMGGLLLSSHDKMNEAFVLSNSLSRRHRWAEILELGRDLPVGQSNIYVNHDINRALYHGGRLPYDMFEFPQVPQALLLTDANSESDLAQAKLCDLLCELGQVNLAERFAAELLSVRGPFGAVLERLAWISIVKGQDGAAQVYLKALKANLVYRNHAHSLLEGLDRGFAPGRESYIRRIQSYLPDDDDTVTAEHSAEGILAALLERNPRNRMAFEYLMAAYLLTGQVDKVVANTERLSDLGYRAIPTLYEEAILVYHGLHNRNLDVTKFNVRSETIQRYVRFVQIRNSMQAHNRTVVLNRLVREFGSSYFFYFTFGRVGQS